MKPAQIKDLRSQLTGSVTDAKVALEAMATDQSVVRVRPSAVVYPASVQDVQVTVAYVHEQAPKKSKHVSLVARGLGQGTRGGALGGGAVIVFPKHLNRILRVSRNSVAVQPGLELETLQTTLQTHGRTVPPIAGVNQGTIGGAIATNAGGRRSLKYGQLAAWTKRLKVVLDDGSIIETKRLSRRELNHKKGLMTREGDLYRGIDGLLQDHQRLIRSSQSAAPKNSSGYRLAAIKNWDGSFDLGQLFVGSEGTLGLITEATLATAPYEPRTTLIASCFANLETAAEAVLKLRKLGPSAIELMDDQALGYLRDNHPNLVPALIPDDLPAVFLLIEFDNPSHLRQNYRSRRAVRIVGKLASSYAVTTSSREQAKLWAPWHDGVAALTWMRSGLPVLDDASVPPEKLAEFMAALHKLLAKHKLEGGVWGHAGDGHLQVAPQLDLSKPKPREAVIKLMDEFATIVTGLGGTISATRGDGILHAPYLEKQHGRELAGVMHAVKQVCDPHGIFNSRVKTGTTKRELEELL